MTDEQKDKLERELAGFLAQLEKKNISLKDVKKWYAKATESFFAASDEERAEEKVTELAFAILEKVMKVNSDFVEKWQTKKISPTDEELNLLVEGGDMLLQTTKFLKDEFPSDSAKSFHKEMEGRIQEIKSQVEREKVEREKSQSQQQASQSDALDNDLSNSVSNSSPQSSNKDSSLNDVSANKSSKNLDSEQKIEMLTNEIFVQQNRLKGMEEKAKSSNFSTEQKEEMIKLKKQLVELQNELVEERNKQQPPKSWLYVVIPLVGFVVVLGVVVAYLLGKRNKKE